MLSRETLKSCFVGALAAATVDVGGPLVEPMAECLIVASSFEQGLVNFRHLKHFPAPSFEKYGVGVGKRFRVQDTANKASIKDTVNGALIRVVGSDPRRMRGAAPGRVLILDEVAQWPLNQVDAMLAAPYRQPGQNRGLTGHLDRYKAGFGASSFRQDVGGRRGILAGTRGKRERQSVFREDVAQG